MLLRGRNERHKRRVFLVARLKVVGDKVADSRAGAFKFGLAGQMDDQNVERFPLRVRYSAKPFIALDMVLEGVFNILAVPLEAFDSSMWLRGFERNCGSGSYQTS